MVTDSDFVEFSKSYSPDSSMVLIHYGIDLGAFGTGTAGTAIIKCIDSTKNLVPSTINGTFTDVKWINNKSATANYDIIPDLRAGAPSKIVNKEINGVKILIKPYDHIGADYKLKIEHLETSPDGKNQLVAYRYSNGKELTPIHISIVPKNSKIPRYGNFYIGEQTSDCILYGIWDKQNELLFFSNKRDSDMVNYYVIKNHPAIRYQIIVNEKKYGNKYLWTE